MNDFSSFEKIAFKLAYRHSLPNVFNDFLDMVICALSGGRMEPEYQSLIERYDIEETNLFSELFSKLVILMDDEGAGYSDVLGEFFMIHITRGLNGQYFTPQPVTDMMAMISGGHQANNKTVCDPACGSGRTLLSAAKVMGKDNLFYAADLDKTCVKMAAINFCLNGLCGQLAHMNTLSYELYSCYEVFYDSSRLFVPTIHLIPNEKSVFYTNPDALKLAVQQASYQRKTSPLKQHDAQLDLFV